MAAKPIKPGEVFELLFAGGTHRNASLDEIDFAVLEACRRGKALMWRDPKTGGMVGLMTWAMIPYNEVSTFMQGERVGGDKFDNEEGDLWVLDFVAPFGGVHKMMNEARRYFARRYGDGVLCNWKRTKRHTPKLGYAVMRDI